MFFCNCKRTEYHCCLLGKDQLLIMTCTHYNIIHYIIDFILLLLLLTLDNTTESEMPAVTEELKTSEVLTVCQQFVLTAFR